MATDHRYQPEGTVGVTGAPQVLVPGAAEDRYQPADAVGIFDLGGSTATVETIADPVEVTGAPNPVASGGGRTATRQINVYLSTTGSPTHFPAPTFVDVTPLLMAEGGVTVSQGVSGRGQEWAAGQFSFTLRNTAGAYSGPALLRRPVLLRVSLGAADIDIRGVITDVTEYRDGVRRLEVSGTDMLGLVADLEVGQTWDEQLKARSAASHWPLVEDGDDALRTTAIYNLSEEPPRDSLGNYIYGGDQSGQTPVYGAIEGCPALSGGGVELEPTGTTGFAGLYGTLAPPAGAGWTIAGWVRRMSGVNGGQVLSIVMANGYTLGFGFTPTSLGFSYGFMAMHGRGTPTDPASFMNISDEYGGPGLPPGQSPWYWITLSMDSGQTIVGSACDTRGRRVTEDWYLDLGRPSVPVSLILGGAAVVDYGWWLPTHCQIADLTWSTTASGFVSPLIRGHLGYPGEAASNRGKRLLTEAGLIPAGGIWNGAQPPAGPLCADDPLTRRPLAQALDTALSSGGRVLHDLPATAGVTSIGLLWPAAIDGVGVTPTAYSGKRVLVGADGFATNTGMLTNAATVTNASGVQVSYEDDASVATYGRRAVTVESQSENSDFDASHASWLAHREATFDRAYALPDLVLDVDGMVADGDTATVGALARTGACVSIPGLLPANYGADTSVHTTQTPTNQNGQSGGWEWGTRITCAVAGRITGWRYYRGSLAAVTSRQLRIWDVATGTVLASATTAGETGTGWFTKSLTTPVLVTAGQQIVSSYWVGAVGFTEATSPTGLSAPIVNGPLTATTAVNGTTAGVYPATTQPNDFFIDVVFNAADDAYNGMVRGLQWQHTPQGAMRLTLRCQALRPLDYAALDDAATATLDNVIPGW